ncbi:MAG TPA: undecaprenyldiphospho-muramoylpentapeptide beta-N-acetylglucosaminyltransferase [Gammaproteobacteria bacterium]|nr:undecaprenyldiphospho-muramoylpentapeptide beta-N-acetylglucosaminyltransferase [Gammaproteobacteria bacterium]
MKKLQRVLIMAGGTGGHVFPGLALARYLREQQIDVQWLGTQKGLEARVIPAASIPLHTITISGLRGKGLKPLLLAPFNLLKALQQARRIIKTVKPDVVVGLGGFVSGPGGLASWLMGYPLIIHEQNARAGLTNKLLARFARKVLTGFPSDFKASVKAITVGNPVRPEIENLPRKPTTNQTGAFHLLVLGGSLGAQALNEIVPRMSAALPASERPVILHQTGDKFFSATQALYTSLGVQAKLVPFIEDMAQAYQWADMVLCRAGALTVAELCAAGIGAIFVPYPYAVDDHQTANADFMVKQQAALCIQQSHLTVERLAAIIKQFTQAPAQRLAMAEAAYQLRKVDVAKRIYQFCEEVCH